MALCALAVYSAQCGPVAAATVHELLLAAT